jgi:hypothetical protein
MATRVDLGGGRFVACEFSMDTGIAEFTEISDEQVRRRVHSLAGSFEEIATQMRTVIEYAKDQGWITDNKARHNRTLVSKTLSRKKNQLRQQPR